MKPRLLDIARRAGVSEATVSRVLAGRPGASEDTRERVHAAARELGRSLPAEPPDRERMVGILVPDLENPIFAQWVERLEVELFERGADALVALRPRSFEREREIFDRFERAGACGIIAVSGHHAQEEGDMSHYRALVQRGMALALVNGVREDVDATYVSSDDARAVHIAADHLHALGHRVIGLAMGDERTYPVRRKVAAFEDHEDGEDRGSRPIAFTDFSHAGGYQAARDLVGRGCTAILCGSDVMAAGALEGVRSMGLAVPDDVSVVGFDDVTWAAITDPPLTTVRQSLPEMARAAVRAVLESGGGSRRPARTELETAPQLIVRGSTGPVPARR